MDWIDRKPNSRRVTTTELAAMACEPHGSERLLALLAEDDLILAQMVEAALSDAGFEVVTINDGDEALAASAAPVRDLAVLVTDIRLGPGLDGWQLARSLRARKPGVAVLYITGDSARQWMAQAVPGSMLLQKPFDAHEVVTAARALLGAGSAGVRTPESLTRELEVAMRTAGACEATGQLIDGPVFSLRHGEVWASWRGRDGEVKLGELSEVVDMMRDFIRQTEFAEELLRRLGVQPDGPHNNRRES